MKDNPQTLKQEIQELQQLKIEYTETYNLQKEASNLKSDLRDLGGLYDFEKFMFDCAYIIGSFCYCVIFLGSKLCDRLDDLCKWMDYINKKPINTHKIEYREFGYID